MVKILTITELKSMQEADLLKEIAEQERSITKLKHGVTEGSEKATHQVKQARRQLARMKTVLGDVRKSAQKPQTVS